MTQVTQLLKQASELEKKAYTGYVTSFTQGMIVNLVKGGIQFEKAAGLAQEACEKDSHVVGFVTNIEAFEKAAEYIEQLESQVVSMEKVAQEIAETVSAADRDDPLNKLASAGFTKEEIEMLSVMPNDLIEKLASGTSQPWDMGGAVGIPREQTDPLLEFLLS